MRNAFVDGPPLALPHASCDATSFEDVIDVLEFEAFGFWEELNCKGE